MQCIKKMFFNYNSKFKAIEKSIIYIDNYKTIIRTK